MKTALTSLICVLALAFGLAAQTTPDLPQNHVDAGIFYNSYTHPALSGWGSYSHRVGDSTYSYSLADVTPGPSLNSNPKVTTTSGLAQRISTFADIQVFAYGTLGLTSSVGASTPVGASAAAGFLVVKPLKNGWTFDIPVRVIAGTGPPQYVFGIGFGWGK